MSAEELERQKGQLKPVSTIITTLTGDKIQINPDGSSVILEQTINLQALSSSATSSRSTSSWTGAPKPVPIPPRFVGLDRIDKSFRKVGRTQSNHVILFKNCTDSKFQIAMNQKLGKLYFVDCVGCEIQVLDSAVLTTKSCEMVNCKDCVLSFDACDCSELFFHDCDGITVQVTNEETLVEDFHMRWYNCKNGKVQIIQTHPGTDPNQVTMIPFDVLRTLECPLSPTLCIATKLVFPLNYPQKTLDEFSSKGNSKNYGDLTAERVKLVVVENDPGDEYVLGRNKEQVLREISEGMENNSVFDRIPVKQLAQLYEEEIEECEEPAELLAEHVKVVAEAIRNGKHVVVYTGAGISTSASIPDYRGPEGAWTLRDKGGKRTKETKELSQALPTYGHYAITHLISKGLVHFLTSTNLDGLHRRSGTPQEKIVELHGNCYREVCGNCDREYLRSYDVLHTRTARWTHLTGRNCGTCGGGLKDTIAHFTENLSQNEWKNAVLNSRKCDVAIVLGTSMNVQPAASLPYKTVQTGGKLFIVNLQRTPYDKSATLKIYAKTDEFMTDRKSVV